MTWCDMRYPALRIDRRILHVFRHYHRVSTHAGQTARRRRRQGSDRLTEGLRWTPSTTRRHRGLTPITHISGRRLQNFVGTTQFSDLMLEFSDPFRLVGRCRSARRHRSPPGEPRFAEPRGALKVGPRSERSHRTVSPDHVAPQSLSALRVFQLLWILPSRSHGSHPSVKWDPPSERGRNRFVRGRQQVDVMVADHLPTSTEGGRADVFTIPAGTSALRTTGDCHIDADGVAVQLSIPTCSVRVLKGAAHREDDRDRGLHP